MSGPALQPGTIRAWKVFTAVACTFTGYQMIFRTDYGDKEHVFSPIQQWYTAQVDRFLGVDSEISKRLKAPSTSLPIRVSSNPVAAATTTPSSSSPANPPTTKAGAAEQQRDER